MGRLIEICERRNIVLLILRGTIFHDKKQSKVFESIAKLTKTTCDVRYIDTLCIEYLEQFDINILFVPDEWRACAKDTELEVKKLLNDKNLTQVDYAIMHGAFPHQYPEIDNVHLHDADFYLSIVKKYILIGHIHIPSVWERIISHGSTDRLRHGEEHDKGLFLIESHRDSFNNDKIVFKINKNAARFKIVNVVGLSKEEIYNVLTSVIKILVDENEEYLIPCFIRVDYDKGNPNIDIINSFKKSYFLIRWSTKSIADKALNKETFIPTVFKPQDINEFNIISILRKRLEDNNVDKDTINETLELVNKYKGQVL